MKLIEMRFKYTSDAGIERVLLFFVGKIFVDKL